MAPVVSPPDTTLTRSTPATQRRTACTTSSRFAASASISRWKWFPSRTIVSSRSLTPLGRACVSTAASVGLVFITSSTTRSQAVDRSVSATRAPPVAGTAGGAGADDGTCTGGAGAGAGEAGRAGGTPPDAGAGGRRSSARGAADSVPGRRLVCAAAGVGAGVASACCRISRCASSTRRNTSSSA